MKTIEFFLFCLLCAPRVCHLQKFYNRQLRLFMKFSLHRLGNSRTVWRKNLSKLCFVLNYFLVGKDFPNIQLQIVNYSFDRKRCYSTVDFVRIEKGNRANQPAFVRSNLTVVVARAATRN